MNLAPTHIRCFADGTPRRTTPNMNWRISHRADRAALPLADKHYNRQKVGSPQFVPPGRCLVLLGTAGAALWVTSWPFAEYVKHRWPGAWVCSCFRRESGPRASQLIREAVAATCWRWPEVPERGMVTFIDPDEVAPIKRRGEWVYGYTWMLAGFKPDGETKGGLLAFVLAPEDMPEPAAPVDGVRQQLLFIDDAGPR
jgi:hypothetical protein